jgi:DNA-binding protein H-NS
MKNPTSMSFDELIGLREKVDSLIASMAAIVKRDLQDKLDRLGNLSMKSKSSPLQRRPHALRGRKIAPKYRNPKNRSETWAGRGMMPLWMRALVKQGRKPEEFAIRGSSAARAKRVVKRGRRKAAR